MSTEPNNAPVAEDQDAKAAAKARAIARARELAAKRKAKQATTEQATDTAPAVGTAQAAGNQDDEAKAAAKARAIARARELAAKRKAEQAANTAQTDTDPAVGSEQAAGNQDDEAKAAAKARAIARARELAAQRKAQQAATTAQTDTAPAVGSEQAADPSDTTNSGKDDKGSVKAQDSARKLAARKDQPNELSAPSSGTVEGVLEPGKPKQSSLFEIFIKGIWKDNPGLCQLLGMCPLLAVTTSAANALGLGIATILVLMLSSSVIALIRRLIVPEVRIPIYVIIIAALVTVVRFEVEANFPALYQQLGIYLSLIATNCIIMGRAEAFAGHNGVIRSLVDAIASGIGFTLVLFALGSIREIVGNGTWLVGASDLLGSWAAGWEMQLYGADYTLLIAILPPGGFFVLAFLIAAKNALDGRAKRKAERRARIDVMRV